MTILDENENNNSGLLLKAIIGISWNHVYVQKPHTLPELKDVIWREVHFSGFQMKGLTI